MIDYGLENKKATEILVLIETFSENECGICSKHRTAPTISKEFSIIIHISNRKRSPIETDDGKKFKIKFSEFFLY